MTNIFRYLPIVAQIADAINILTTKGAVGQVIELAPSLKGVKLRITVSREETKQ